MDPTPREPGFLFPGRLVRTRLYEQVAEQITSWISENGLNPGDRLPAERELAARLGVSRPTLSQALVALEVIGVVAVRHGDGTVVTQSRTRRIVEAIREHADRLPEIIETLIKETRIESLSQPERPRASLAGHRAIAEAIRAEDPDAASEAMHAHVTLVSDVALLREAQ